MSTDILRLLWIIISEYSSNKIAGLSDDALVGGLVNQIHQYICLSSEEELKVRAYINTRRPLIREILLYQSL